MTENDLLLLENLPKSRYLLKLITRAQLALQITMQKGTRFLMKQKTLVHAELTLFLIKVLFSTLQSYIGH